MGNSLNEGIERRSFLKVVGAGAIGALLFDTISSRVSHSTVSAQTLSLSKFTEQLPIPPLSTHAVAAASI